MSLRDAAARELARFELEKNVIVEAGAGTGKTTLLIDRVLSLLLGGRGGVPAKVEEIVALTFTDKAASEIRLRLAEALGDLSARIEGGELDEKRRARMDDLLQELRKRFKRTPEQVLALSQTALKELDRAEIGTIHSFCSSLLRLYPLEAGVAPDFQVDADEAAFDELFEGEWALWLDRELGEAPPRKALWKKALAGASVEVLHDLARGLASPRVDLDKTGLGPEMKDRLKQMAAACERLKGSGPKPKGSILAYLDWMKGAFEAAAAGRTHERPPRPTKNPASWPKSWPPEGEEEYDALAEVAVKLDPAAEELLACAVALVRPFVEAFRVLYRRRGFLSYDDLLVSARDLVRGQPGVREDLKRRFKALLIDEFQDTDPLQGELLLFLGEREKSSAEEWRRSKPAEGKLFVVGDPKQSIYRFRGADMLAFESFTEHLERHGALSCALQTNFRSRPEVVEAVNRCFEPLMRARAGLQPGYLPIYPGPAQGEAPGAVEWVGFQAAEGSKLKADEARAAEAEWIAGWIEKRPPSMPLKDIAIVLRVTSPLPVYLDALRRRGIPYVVEGERRFYAAQEVVDFLNLLRAADDPDDALSLVGLLRSPLAGFEDEEVCRLARAGKLDYRKGGTVAEPLYALLRRLNAAAGRRPMPELVRLVMEETPFVELSAAAYHHQQTASNLLKFSRLAWDAGERGATLKEFIAEVEESVRELHEEGESPLADEGLDAVRLLTVHKAKGLEYPVVLMPNLASAPRGGGGGAVFVRWADGTVGLRLGEGGVQNAAMAVLAAEEKVRQKAEELRVLYVGMTRPKERLILLGGPGSKGTFAGLLDDAGALPRRTLPAPEQDRRSLPRTVLEGFRLPEGEAFAKAWEARRKREEALSKAPLFLRPSAAGEDASESGERGPRSARAALLGSLCHAVLERWDYRKGADLGKAVSEAARAVCLDAPGQDEKALVMEARGLLEKFLASKAAKRIAASEILGRELPFVMRRGTATVRGVMDLVCQDEQGVVVYDYKTGRAPKEGAQGELYSKAVEGALGLRKVRFELILLREP